MIKTETIMIGERPFLHTYSDEKLRIMRDGEIYDEAIDPVDSGRVYTETDEKIQNQGNAVTSDEALSIITGGEEV